MAWYAVYVISDGSLVSVGQALDPAQIPSTMAFTPLAGKPDRETEMWDPATQTFIAKVFTKAELESTLLNHYNYWKMWKETLAEATARGLPAGAITALTNQTNVAWTTFANAINAWRNA
jgi:hypothetical protein